MSLIPVSGEGKCAAKLVTVDRNGSNRTLPNRDHSLFTALPFTLKVFSSNDRSFILSEHTSEARQPVA